MMKRFSFGGVSIQQRLSIFICALLLSVIVTFGWISYISVKNEALNTGKERLRSLSDQLSSMLSQSAQATLTLSHNAANDESIKKSLQTEEAQSRIDALETLRKLRPDSNWVLAELINEKGQPILHSSKDSIQSLGNFDSLLAISMHKDFPGVGKIHVLKNSMYYSVSVPVTDNKKTIGYVVRWQRVAITQDALERLSGLMGKARLYLGNKDGSLWTDMMKPVSYQQLNSDQILEPFEYSGPKGKNIAVAKPIANTSWLISVEFPRQLIMETASRFLRRIIIIGGILIIVGIFIAWLMSRNISKPLNKLTAATSAIAAGNYSIKVEEGRKDELGKLAQAFNAMIGQVSKAKEGLEQKVIETSEMNEQLRGLSAYLQNVREDERIHIAREIHDELGQLLTGFKMDVSLLRKKLGESTDPVITEKLEYMLTIVDEAVRFVRKLATELRPSILDDLGLVPALEWHSHEFEKRYNIKVAFHPLVQELHTSPVIATGLFRMYQESLTNVARHSSATKVEASLNISNDRIILSIADNGKGFDTSRTSKKTLGLLGMKERATMVGGQLEIISEPGKGTTITITVRQEVGKLAVL
jgi:signal transduction histidine kinase